MNQNALPDRKLLEAIARHDVEAFNALYNRYNKVLLSKAARRIQDIGLAEEVMQDFWIDIWTRPARIRCNAAGDAGGFLVNYLLFRVLDFYRKERVHALALATNETPEQLENELAYTHIAETYQLQELEAVVSGILNQLPDKMGELFLMLHRDGYTVKETAQKLQINERTVKYKSKQVVETLKKMVEKEGVDAQSLRTVIRQVSSSVIYIVCVVDTVM